jgi:HEPN domain-containing protein
MSEIKDRNHAKQWIRQAIDDHESAVVLMNAGKYPQSCFFFQQAAEKAIKALWYAYGEEPWGHAVSRFMETFPEDTVRDALVSELLDEARELDKFYIPTRYPNGLPSDLIPADAYTKTNAVTGKDMSQKIINRIQVILQHV